MIWHANALSTKEESPQLPNLQMPQILLYAVRPDIQQGISAFLLNHKLQNKSEVDMGIGFDGFVRKP